MNTREKTVVVAMSGGVDSSVAAALLHQTGFQVIGMMLRLWSENGMEAFNRCCTPEAMGLARRVAGILGIPFYVMDVREIFHQTVVQYFIDGYSQGVTPNPCLVCNRQIRFGLLLQHAKALGASHLATGHYAQSSRQPDGSFQLQRGADRQKDQSYVLSVLNQDQLNQALFPVGKYTKQQIRDLAAQFALPVADRLDSQDLCFLANGDYRDFLQRHVPSIENPGPIKNLHGEIIGEHRGLAYYTIGQRRGLGVSTGQPLYVIRKDLKLNSLVVGHQDDLGRSMLTAMDVNWISGLPPTERFQAEVQIRYRAPQVPAEVIPLAEDRIKINFELSLRDITPGQMAAIYSGDTCLGGGIIELNGVE